ncbi:MAG: hydratase [Treponema sp.]|jgi:aconitate hydratase|nr:hydratase [Treponema sp.]
MTAVELFQGGVFLVDGGEIIEASQDSFDRFAAKAKSSAKTAGERLFAGFSGFRAALESAREGTIAHGILASHNRGEARFPSELSLRFDALASHDITFVGIIQTAKLSGLKAFPVPYILTNCHNSLCAVGGTINEDDHVFGLSAAKKYGGVYVPPHLAVIHSYMREAWAGCGRMILGSDSHTRYGALGTLAVGEGGGELVKQLLSQGYDMAWPRIIAVYLEGKPRPGVGPQDVALALAGEVFKNGFAKNAVLEFVGPGVAGLPADYRCGIDVMTTETACWSSVWKTDDVIRDWLALHGRAADYRELVPAPAAYYDGLVKINLDAVRPMIAMPFHPSNVYELEDVIQNPGDVFSRVEKDGAFGKEVNLGLMEKIGSNGEVHVDQGIIAGCAGGTFDNIMAASHILNAGVSGIPGAGVPADALPGQSAGRSGFAADAFSLSVYPGSQSIFLELVRNGAASELIAAGAVLKTAFCGPCFGAGDVPSNKAFSIRHTTRNFPNREGSKPGQGQIASVALMDARSIAATARNGGVLSSALGAGERPGTPYRFDDAPYRARVYNGIGRPGAGELVYGPNITDWPAMEAMGEHILFKIVSFITDPVTTTDELIPSGETSSYRSNPLALAEFTLSRKDPAYVGKAKAVRDAAPWISAGRPSEAGGEPGGTDAALSEALPELPGVLETLRRAGYVPADLRLASAIFAVKPGDGSAREQAARCQRVLGGGANFANEYATKRYRSNLINWGLIPFIVDGTPPFKNDDYVFVPDVRKLISGTLTSVEAVVIRPGGTDGDLGSGESRIAASWILPAPELNPMERELLLAGSLVNYNRRQTETDAAGRGGQRGK